MSEDAFDEDSPRVAPDQPKGSGDKAPRVAVALILTVVVTIVLVITSLVLLWAL